MGKNITGGDIISSTVVESGGNSFGSCGYGFRVIEEVSRRSHPPGSQDLTIRWDLEIDVSVYGYRTTIALPVMQEFPQALIEMFGRLAARARQAKESGKYKTVFCDGWEHIGYSVSVAHGLPIDP